MIGLALTMAHSTRHTNRTVFGNHLIVRFVLLIPKTGKNNNFHNFVSINRKLTERLIMYLTSSVLKYL